MSDVFDPREHPKQLTRFTDWFAPRYLRNNQLKLVTQGVPDSCVRIDQGTIDLASVEFFIINTVARVREESCGLQAPSTVAMPIA
jgi:hypothetical protein